MAAKTQTPHKNETITNTVGSEPFIYDDDKIRTAQFDDSGYAYVVVEFDTCVSNKQCKMISESDTWEIESIHRIDGGVSVHLHEKES